MAKCSAIYMLMVSALLLFLQDVDCRVIGDYRTEKEISFPLEGGSTARYQRRYQRLTNSEAKVQTAGDTNDKHEMHQQNHSFQNKKHSVTRSQKDKTTSRSNSHKTGTTTRRQQLPTKSTMHQLFQSATRQQLPTTLTIHQPLPSATRQQLQDPSLRSRREENADEPSQIEEDPDVQTIPSIHGKDCSCHDKKLSNYEVGFNSTDMVPGPFGFFTKFFVDTNQGQPWSSPSTSWYPQQFQPQQWNFPQFQPQPQPLPWWPGGQAQGAIPTQGNTGIYPGIREIE